MTSSPTSIVARGLTALTLAMLAVIGFANTAVAHAQPTRALPPIGGSVATAPARVEIWFSEEATNATTIKVFGPDGVRVDLGNSTLDLEDAQRVHVTVDVLKNLDPGIYRVEWSSVSGTDGDAATGTYNFAIGVGSPVASPAVNATALDVGTPVSIAAAVPPQFRTSKVDDRVLTIGIAAGVLAAIGIYLFWRWQRPKHPVV